MKNKISIIATISIIIAAIIVLLSIASNGLMLGVTNFDDLNNEIINIMNSEPHNANMKNEEYVYYVPDEYKVSVNENSSVLESNAGVFTLYMGYDVKVDEAFLSSINPNKSLVYEYEKTTSETMQYFYVWENDDNTYSVMLGQNDVFIEGIVKKSKIEKYAIDMATILNSVQKIDNSEPIEVN